MWFLQKSFTFMQWVLVSPTVEVLHPPNKVDLKGDIETFYHEWQNGHFKQFRRVLFRLPRQHTCFLNMASDKKEAKSNILETNLFDKVQHLRACFEAFLTWKLAPGYRNLLRFASILAKIGTHHQITKVLISWRPPKPLFF